jgi:hypothetical protein
VIVTATPFVLAPSAPIVEPAGWISRKSASN